MDAAEAVALVAEWILWENLDYPTEGLLAERFEGGWRVFTPREVDGCDATFQRSEFLIGDSGYIEEVSASIPARQAEAGFSAEELAARRSEEDHGPATH
jgi:hypothetical protein